MGVGIAGYIETTEVPEEVASASEAVKLAYTADSALGGHRMVITNIANGKAMYASNDNLAHAHGVIGMTLGAANMDEEVIVQISGQIEESSWAWTPGGLLYLSTTGLITHTYPSGALFSRVVAFAETATRILLVQQPSLILS